MIDTEVKINPQIFNKIKNAKIFFKRQSVYQKYKEIFNINKFLRRDTHYIKYCIKNFKILDGLCLEFGTYKGERIKQIATCVQKKYHYIPNHHKHRIVYGFDSFEGLSEEWTEPETNKLIKNKKAFNLNGKLPNINKKGYFPNVCLVKGYFEDSIPKFLSKNNLDQIALLHVDCDLKSSTIDIFENISHLIKVGTLILFDDFHNVGCTQWWDEYYVFETYAKKYNWKYKIVACVIDGGQTAVVIE